MKKKDYTFKVEIESFWTILSLLQKNEEHTVVIAPEFDIWYYTPIIRARHGYIEWKEQSTFFKALRRRRYLKRNTKKINLFYDEAMGKRADTLYNAHRKPIAG